MLVISRKAGERIVIGPNIVITVLEVRGNVVKLGCEAPTSLPIYRQEMVRQANDSPRLLDRRAHRLTAGL